MTALYRITALVPLASAGKALETLAAIASAPPDIALVNPDAPNAPTTEPARRRERGNVTPQHETKLGKAVLDFMRQNGPAKFTIAHISAGLAKAGLSPNSASPAVSALVKSGHVVRLGDSSLVLPEFGDGSRAAGDEQQHAMPLDGASKEPAAEREKTAE